MDIKNGFCILNIPECIVYPQVKNSNAMRHATCNTTQKKTSNAILHATCHMRHHKKKINKIQIQHYMAFLNADTT